jgi:glycerol-3-phosphate dehydrogenase
VVGIGAGIVDGMGLGHNTKAAVIRLGLMEMVKFGEMFIKGTLKANIFLQVNMDEIYKKHEYLSEFIKHWKGLSSPQYFIDL